MKTFKLVTFILLGVIILPGCYQKKELEIDMTIIEDGDLQIRITDSQDAGIANVRVKLNTGNGSSILEESVTDANGWVTFNGLLSGTYGVTAEEVIINEMPYYVYRSVQVLPGLEKEYIIDASEYCGSVTITVLDWNTEMPIEGIHVGIFNREHYRFSMDFSEVTNIVFANSITDENGIVRFEEIPLIQYGRIVYTDEQNFSIEPNSFTLSTKGQEENVTIYYY
jgi:hypothetical protein